MRIVEKHKEDNPMKALQSISDIEREALLEVFVEYDGDYHQRTTMQRVAEFTSDNEGWLECDYKSVKPLLMAICTSSKGNPYLHRINSRSIHADDCKFKGVERDSVSITSSSQPINLANPLRLHRHVTTHTKKPEDKVTVSIRTSHNYPRLARVLYSFIENIGANKLSLDTSPDIIGMYKQLNKLADSIELAEGVLADKFFKTYPDVDTLAYILKKYDYDWPADSRPYGLCIAVANKIERFVDADNPQVNLFQADACDDTNVGQQETEDLPDNVTTIASYQRRKGRKKLNPELPLRIVTITVPDNQRHCGCGAKKHFLRYESSERYGFIPAKFEVIEERREVLACREGCDKPVTAPKPLHILPKTMASEELLAHIVVSKLVDRQPLDHLAHQFARRFDVSITRKTLINWFNQLGIEVQPLIKLLKDILLDYDVSSLDPTGLQVLKEPGPLATTRSYAYSFRGGPPDTPVTLFEYNATAHKQFVTDWYEGYTGDIHVDADNFFDALKALEHITIVNCNAHARRKFESISKVTHNEGIAKYVLRDYKKLYQIERYAKTEKLTAEQRYRLRLEKSQPILSKLQVYLLEKQPTVMSKSPLGKGIAYFLTHYEGLTNFLKDVRLDIDNNLTEQENKVFAILRKNFLFCDTANGAKALCNLLSLVRTVIRNGVEPYEYLATVFKRLPYCRVLEDYEVLLPWNSQEEADKAKCLAAA